MLDNWTTDEFFSEFIDVDIGAFEEFASYNGRIAITDNEELEKLYDTFVKSYEGLKDKYSEWQNKVE